MACHPSSVCKSLDINHDLSPKHSISDPSPFTDLFQTFWICPRMLWCTTIYLRENCANSLIILISWNYANFAIVNNSLLNMRCYTTIYLSYKQFTGVNNSLSLNNKNILWHITVYLRITKSLLLCTFNLRIFKLLL